MKKGIAGLLLLSMTLFSCQKESVDLKNCDAGKLRKFDMQIYQGEDLSECDFFLARYEWNAQVYYIIDNYCADIAWEPEDCDCVLLSEESDTYDRFILEAEFKEIVGIKG